MPAQGSTTGSAASRSSTDMRIAGPLPLQLWWYVLKSTRWHQLALVVLTVAVFLIEVAPLELQRRIVNDAVKHRDFQLIVNLCGIYAGIALIHGSAKLGLNIYRAWIGQKATRDLRRRIQSIEGAETLSVEEGGVEVSMVIAESEPVGQFVAEAVSEPLLQLGILASVLAYMVHLDPIMALIAGAIFVPQLLLVPALQQAINNRTKDAIALLRQLSGYLIAPFAHPDTVPDSRGDAKEGVIDRIFSLNMGVSELKYSMNFLMNFCTHLQIIAALLYGGWLVQNNELEVGGVVAFLSGLSRITDPWGDLVNYLRDASVIRMKYALLAGTFNRFAKRDT